MARLASPFAALGPAHRLSAQAPPTSGRKRIRLVGVTGDSAELPHHRPRAPRLACNLLKH